MTDIKYVDGMNGLIAYNVKNADGLLFWTIINPKLIDMTPDEKIIKKQKLSKKLFESLSVNDKEFIKKEYKKMY